MSVSLSEKLLLAYAVECGLKLLVMRDQKCEDYHSLPESNRTGHDLREALKIARAPAKLTIRESVTRHGKPPQETVLPQYIHQCFRYGIDIVHDPEVVTQLRAALAWVKERLT